MLHCTEKCMVCIGPRVHGCKNKLLESLLSSNSSQEIMDKGDRDKQSHTHKDVAPCNWNEYIYDSHHVQQDPNAGNSCAAECWSQQMRKMILGTSGCLSSTLMVLIDSPRMTSYYCLPVFYNHRRSRCNHCRVTVSYTHLTLPTNREV